MEISKRLGIPKSTMHYWFKDLQWSEKIKKELTEKAARLSTKRMKRVAKANKDRWEKWREQHRIEAKKEFPEYRNNPLFVSGLMLYWGKGDGNLKNDMRLCNIDSRMIVLFNQFLLNICKWPKSGIYLTLTIYPDLSDQECKKYWISKTGISPKQFGKTQVIYGRHPTKRLEYGICTIRAGRSRGLKEKIVIWTDLVFKYLKKHKRKRA